MPKPLQLANVEAELVHQTELAYLIDDGTKEVWVPKSLVEYDEETGIFTMPEKFAYEKGLI